jgi:hypothetical protein
MTAASKNRLSPGSRREDEGEGLERSRPESSLTLSVSLRKGEATQYTRGHSKISPET